MVDPERLDSSPKASADSKSCLEDIFVSGQLVRYSSHSYTDCAAGSNKAGGGHVNLGNNIRRVDATLRVHSNTVYRNKVSYRIHISVVETYLRRSGLQNHFSPLRVSRCCSCPSSYQMQAVSA